MAIELLKAYAKLELTAEAQKSALEGADWGDFEATSLLREEAFNALVALEEQATTFSPAQVHEAQGHIQRIAAIDRRLESLLGALAAATSAELGKLNQGIHALHAYADDPAITAKFLDTAQ